MEWRKIEGVWVSDAGTLWRDDHEYKTEPRDSGYCKVIIDKQFHFVARLVCRAFHGEPKEGETVDHKNRIKHDNRAKNLRWATKKQQQANKDALDRPTHGLNMPIEYRAITSNEWKRAPSQQLLAEMGFDQASISRCVNGKQRQTKGHYFRISDIPNEPKKVIKKDKVANNAKWRSVQQIFDGVQGPIYKSALEAERSTGVAAQNIAKVCRGTRKNAGGFDWIYA
tara:strand:- start:2512 stop:3186 length:675 start_codon:yes stop_codon:yes gene_type:complete